jgi:hypothetical protein
MRGKKSAIWKFKLNLKSRWVILISFIAGMVFNEYGGYLFLNPKRASRFTRKVW